MWSCAPHVLSGGKAEAKSAMVATAVATATANAFASALAAIKGPCACPSTGGPPSNATVLAVPPGALSSPPPVSSGGGPVGVQVASASSPSPNAGAVLLVNQEVQEGGWKNETKVETKNGVITVTEEMKQVGEGQNVKGGKAAGGGAVEKKNGKGARQKQGRG